MATTWAQRRRDRIDETAGRSLTAEAFQRLRRNPVALVGAVIVVVFGLVAALAPLIVRPGVIPGAQAGFPLGGDQLGRDFFSRVVLASRQTLLVGVLATLLGLAVG